MNFETLSHLPRRRKLSAFVWAAHLVIFVVSGYLAFMLRFDFVLPKDQVGYFWFALPIWVSGKAVLFNALRLHRHAWRFISATDVWRLLYANLAASSLCTAIILWGSHPGFPRSIYFLDFLISMLLTAGVLIAARTLVDAKALRKTRVGKPAFIYGAGEAGVMLLREARCNPKLGYQVEGFIDDDRSKVGMLIHGIRVFGSGEDLPALARKHEVHNVLIAIPSASPQQLADILGHCGKAGVDFRTLPYMSELVSGSSFRIRDVAIEDLLGRTTVWLEEENIRALLNGQTVMVTGSAGSIGSELCRQIARFGPKIVVGFDLCETGMFHLDRELRSSFPDVTFVPVIGDVQKISKLRNVMEIYRPSVVYHAAAYKHVPMMESHIFEAIENNVIATFNVAWSACQSGAKSFVMISTDKAVRPTSVMGLTKRAAEILVNSVRSTETKFVSVRFGNVLGSAGSVVPIFRAQIAAGGPVTVTHPDMERYFMTIPEATQLVLQSSAMGKGGEIFVLDMGEPIKIVDLARKLILLSGLCPDKDVRIEFTGIRPGERLREELNTNDEETMPTYHEKIRIFNGNRTRIPEVERWISGLRQFCAARNLQVVLELKEIVPEYNPSGHVLRQIFDLNLFPALTNGPGTAKPASVLEAASTLDA